MKKWMLTALFVLLGGALGYGYYHFFGCTTGCPITSNPWTTVGYFSLIALLLSSAFVPAGKKKSD